MYHMKTATVRDLRYSFADVSQWINEGEVVQITRRGRAFAILAPAKQKTSRPVAWPDFEARRGRLFPKSPDGNLLSEIISEGRGDR
jgi:antitoxin (DNA-binding transcriptional repressor) of toxin-antitoxin stability system